MTEPPPRQRFVIEGAAITGISAFYAEINRVFMAGEDWQLGPSLDALNDMLYGGYGALSGGGPATIEWRDMPLSRAALGRDATCAFLKARLAERPMFNGSPIVSLLADLDGGVGKTYFDIVMEVFAEHPLLEIIEGSDPQCFTWIAIRPNRLSNAAPEM